ncbi:unnamed protein product [Paramecium octaurelia]|uniref:Uncharacterized protein n=1 Tax=Paramecium octaurelia TaxID=43137 RepID=A0A8S1T517_PAROT|nr:unnamed protein product [Paramecium octaurelia]
MKPQSIFYENYNFYLFVNLTMSKWLDLSLTYNQINFKCQQPKSRSPMNSVFEIEGKKLYLGNINAANDSQYLKHHNVGAVLSIIDTSDIKLDRSIIHLWIAAEDREDVQITRYFEQAANFIKDHLQHTNVLVHCYAGISRSSSLIIAYLIRHAGFSLQDAIIKLKSQRPQVDPNDGFMEQLKQFEVKVRNQKQCKSENGAKNVSKFLNISTSIEKSSINCQQSNKSIQNYNIYSRLNSITNIKEKQQHVQNLTIQKSKTSFLDKTCSPTNLSTTNKNGKSFILNNLHEDPLKQYQKIKNSQNLLNQQILGMKNIYSQHGRFHSMNN